MVRSASRPSIPPRPFSPSPRPFPPFPRLLRAPSTPQKGCLKVELLLQRRSGGRSLSRGGRHFTVGRVWPQQDGAPLPKYSVCFHYISQSREPLKGLFGQEKLYQSTEISGCRLYVCLFDVAVVINWFIMMMMIIIVSSQRTFTLPPPPLSLRSSYTRSSLCSVSRLIITVLLAAPGVRGGEADLQYLKVYSKQRVCHALVVTVVLVSPGLRGGEARRGDSIQYLLKSLEAII